jgi:hypothetical protein
MASPVPGQPYSILTDVQGQAPDTSSARLAQNVIVTRPQDPAPFPTIAWSPSQVVPKEWPVPQPTPRRGE